MASFKRTRSPNRQEISPSSSATSSPTVKAARTSATPPPHAPGSTPTTNHILCTLPPTCHHPNHHTKLAGTRELEAHYAMYHAHVCEQKGCGCVFPDARLLELHQTECHDPLAAVRQERGEKIFECHVATCERIFSTPKTRRLHLIEAHGYPKEYFFAVTNKGVGGLLKRWGEGASMLRRQWRPRKAGTSDGEDGNDQAEEGEGDDDDAHEEGGVFARQTGQGPTDDARASEGEDDNEDEEDEILLGKIQIDRPPVTTAAASERAPSNRNRRGKDKDKGKKNQAAGEDVDALAQSLGSLSLVPSSIQFGRGAKRGAQGRGGHGWRGSGGKSGGAPQNAEGVAFMDVDQAVPSHGRGRGHGRGGRGVPPVPRGGAIRTQIMRGRGRAGRGSGRI